MTKVTDQTLIPIGLAILTIGGGAAWLTVVHEKVAVSADRIKEMSEDQKKYTEDLHQINARLARIETLLERSKGE